MSSKISHVKIKSVIRFNQDGCVHSVTKTKFLSEDGKLLGDIKLFRKTENNPILDDESNILGYENVETIGRTKSMHKSSKLYVVNESIIRKTVDTTIINRTDISDSQYCEVTEIYYTGGAYTKYEKYIDKESEHIVSSTQEEYDSSNIKCSEYRYEYNDDESLKFDSRKYFNEDGTINSRSTIECTYIYDDQKRLIKKDIINDDKKSYVEYIFDSDKLVEEKYYIDDEDSLSFTDGYISTSKNITYEYNDNGKVERKVTDWYKRDISNEELYKYDDHGRVTSSIRISNLGTHSTINTYDQNGRLIEITTSTNNNFSSVKDSITTTYKYSSIMYRGIECEKIESYKNGVCIKIVFANNNQQPLYEFYLEEYCNHSKIRKYYDEKGILTAQTNEEIMPYEEYEEEEDD